MAGAGRTEGEVTIATMNTADESEGENVDTRNVESVGHLSARHVHEHDHGILFLAWLYVTWCSMDAFARMRSEGRVDWTLRLAHGGMLFFLALSVIPDLMWTGNAVAWEVTRPYCGAEALAKFIKAKNLTKYRIAAARMGDGRPAVLPREYCCQLSRRERARFRRLAPLPSMHWTWVFIPTAVSRNPAISLFGRSKAKVSGKTLIWFTSLRELASCGLLSRTADLREPARVVWVRWVCRVRDEACRR